MKFMSVSRRRLLGLLVLTCWRRRPSFPLVVLIHISLLTDPVGHIDAPSCCFLLVATAHRGSRFLYSSPSFLAVRSVSLFFRRSFVCLFSRRCLTPRTSQPLTTFRRLPGPTLLVPVSFLFFRAPPTWSFFFYLFPWSL